VFAALSAPYAIYRDDQVGRFSKGHDDLRDFHAHFVVAIFDIRMEFSKAFRSGDMACLERRFSGQQTGIYHGKPPIGIAFTGNGVTVMTFAPDGRIALVAEYYDSGGGQKQLSPVFA